MLFNPKEKGQSLVEYSLIIVLVVIVVIVILALVGTRIFENLYSRIIASMPG